MRSFQAPPAGAVLLCPCNGCSHGVVTVQGAGCHFKLIFNCKLLVSSTLKNAWSLSPSPCCQQQQCRLKRPLQSHGHVPPGSSSRGAWSESPSPGPSESVSHVPSHTNQQRSASDAPSPQSHRLAAPVRACRSSSTSSASHRPVPEPGARRTASPSGRRRN